MSIRRILRMAAWSALVVPCLAACNADDAATGDVTSRCYATAGSALGRVPNDAGGAAVGPGWIRLDGAADTDSGSALLLDADGGSLNARWRRAGPDSLHLVGFDDFLRVEMQLERTDAGLRGTARATSDAAIERDSSGVMRSMDRRSDVSARATACDSMPRVRNA